MSLPQRRTMASWWDRLQGWPMGPQFFSFMVGRTARYSGTIGARITALEAGRAVVQMRDRAAVRNHLQSVHAIALMNLGELVTGIAVMYQVDGRGRGIVSRLSMDYTKKARGTITGTCEVQVPPGAGTHDLVVEGVLRDEAGDTVATVSATWRLELNAA